MSEKTKPYMAFLCHMETRGKLVPYESIYLAANKDEEALQELARWAKRLNGLIKGETWLLIKQGDRTVRAEKRPSADRRKEPGHNTNGYAAAGAAMADVSPPASSRNATARACAAGSASPIPIRTPKAHGASRGLRGVRG